MEITNYETLKACTDPKIIVKKIKSEINNGSTLLIGECLKRLIELDYYPGDKLINTLLKNNLVYISQLAPYKEKCKITEKKLKAFFRSKASVNIETIEQMSPKLYEAVGRIKEEKYLNRFAEIACKSATFANVIVTHNPHFTKEQLQKIYIANNDIRLCKMLEEKIKQK